MQPVIVSVLPKDGPRITGGRPRYQAGDTVSVNCTSGRSKPATRLNWFINGEPAEPDSLREHDSIITGREGLETSTLGLEFKVETKHFRRGDMKLKVRETSPSYKIHFSLMKTKKGGIVCVAYLYLTYNKMYAMMC